MGNKLANQTPTQLQDYYLHELPGSTVFESNLGNGRFLKTIQCRHSEGPRVVIKVYFKRPPFTDLQEYIDKLKNLAEKLSIRESKNVYPMQVIIDTEKAGFLMRQYFKHSLTSRMGTRPFLSTIEKMWISFQLLKALQECNNQGICHGDIKSENIMVTSWDWVYLTDFACYKPTFIPEDGPSDFSFFFDTSGYRTCYLAPERFISGKEVKEGDLTHEMDIFSLGCVIAELFLDGIPRTIFTLAQLLSYRKGEYDPYIAIDRLDCEPAKKLIKQMIKKEPSERKNASWYLQNWSELGFPDYFEHLHEYISNLMSMDPDTKIIAIKNDFPELLRITKGKLQMNNQFINKTHHHAVPVEAPATEGGSQETAILDAEKEYNDYALSLSTDGSALLCDTYNFIINLESTPTTPLRSSTSTLQTASTPNTPHKDINHLIHQSKELNQEEFVKDQTINKQSYVKTKEIQTESLPGMVMILSIVCASMTIIKSPMIKVEALQLLVNISTHVEDDFRLQRIIPYIISYIEAQSPIVRSFSVTTLTMVLDMVTTFPPSDIHLFPEYIMPSVLPLLNDAEVIVRETFARHLPRLAEVAKRFLEASQIFIFKQADSLSLSSINDLKQINYDKGLKEIHDIFWNVTTTMFCADCPNIVKIALLSDITTLAKFFGRQRTVDTLLPLIVTFLNDDWEVKAAFWQNITGVCEFIGSAPTESFIYPCIIQYLTYRVEYVVNKTIHCLSMICAKNLFRKPILFDIIKKTLPLALHPCVWIREAVIETVAVIANQLDDVDIYTHLLELLQPFIHGDIVFIHKSHLKLCLLPQVSRSIYNQAIDICNKAIIMISNETQSFRPRVAAVAAQNVPKNAFPFDPEDTFIKYFVKLLTDANISEHDQKLLLLMSSSLKDATRNLTTDVYEEDPSENAFDEYLTYAHSVPSDKIHVLSVPMPGESQANIEQRIEVDPAWRYFLGKKTSLCTALKKNNNIITSLYATNSQLLKLQSVPELPNFGKVKKLSHPTGPNAQTVRNWKPNKVLVAHLTEHKSSVNQLKITQDSQFFASASSDGTVRIWDCLKLEKKVANRAALVFDQGAIGGKALSIAIIEHSHSIAVGSSFHRLSIFRVDHEEKKDTLDYKSCTQFEIQYSAKGPINVVEHYHHARPSLVVCGTSSGHVSGFDLRMQKEAFEFDNTQKAGSISSMIIDPNHNWLVTGTSRGCYTCWDLRFGLPINSWWQPGEYNRIYRMVPSRIKHRGACFYSSVGDGKVFLWDIENVKCKQLWQTLDAPIFNNESVPVPNFRTSYPPVPSSYADTLKRTKEENHEHRALLTVPNAPYFITGSADKCIRYWDLGNFNSSGIISRPKDYHPVAYRYEKKDDMEVFVEYPTGLSRHEEKKKFAKKPSKNHNDTIMDLVVGEHPFNFLVSASRDGVIKVWK